MLGEFGESDRANEARGEALEWHRLFR
jgi:hypothetical protein